MERRRLANYNEFRNRFKRIFRTIRKTRKRERENIHEKGKRTNNAILLSPNLIFLPFLKRARFFLENDQLSTHKLWIKKKKKKQPKLIDDGGYKNLLPEIMFKISREVNTKAGNIPHGWKNGRSIFQRAVRLRRELQR